MAMRNKTVAMTMVNGKIVDNYEEPKKYGVSLIHEASIVHQRMRLMKDAIVIYHLIRSPEVNLGEVDDIEYFNNKMLQGFRI